MKKLTKEEFIENSIKIHGNKYDYSLMIYVKNDIKVKIYCNKCKEYFYQRPHDHMSGRGCPDCRTMKTETFIEKCSTIHNNFYDYSKTIFKNLQTKVIITCPIHGDFYQRSDGHITGKGCKKCADDRLKKDTEYFIKKSNKIHNNFYLYGKTIYIEAKKEVIITCPIHGDFEQIAYNHTSGYGCPKCNLSSGERIILNYLNMNNIEYEFQKTFDNCKGIKNKLPFDFYLTNCNICIEYDGIQHFKSVEYFGGDKTFIRTLECDQIKTEYCLNNNIRLLRIKYNENIEEKLKELFPISC